MDTGFGATPSATANKIASPSVNAVSRPEGDSNFFKGGAKFEGNSRTSTGFGATGGGMSEKDLADWKARGDLQNSKNPEYVALEKERSNPNNARFNEIADKVKDINTFMSGDPLTRKYQTLQLGALNHTLNALAPLTSFGHYGVAGLQTDTTKRGQDIGAETIRRGQDIGAETTRRGQDLDTVTKSSELGLKAKDLESLTGYRGAAAAKSQAEADILKEQGKPDKVREKTIASWLDSRQKYILEGLSSLDPNATPEIQAKQEANLTARFDRLFPVPVKSAKKNADGTITVHYADGTTKTGKPKQ